MTTPARLARSRHRSLMTLVVTALAATLLPISASRTAARTQVASPDISLFRELTWRPVGVPRSGRVTAAAATSVGAPVFYAAAEGGGLWRSADFGLSWQPLFDDQPTAAIGAVAVAPSRGEIVYAGTGDGVSAGGPEATNGIYRSADGGQTWTRTALAAVRQTTRLLVSPTDANRLLAAFATTTGGTGVRGVYRSTDGGTSFDRVLDDETSTGATELAIASGNGAVVYAALAGPAASLHKSIDGGDHWRRLSLSPQPLASRISVAVADTIPNRVIALATAPAGDTLYRSDDGGDTWPVVTPLGPRSSSAASLDHSVVVNPRNPETVYVVSGVIWQSTDGGRQFHPWTTPPGTGVERLWIDPNRPGVMIAWGIDGARITVNDGASWSDDTLPTAAFGHVAVDAAFPYRVCGTARQNAVMCIPVRTESGALGSHEWTTLPGVTGALAPDPLDGDVLYAGGVTRFDRKTGQATAVGPPAEAALGAAPGAPLAFSGDARMLYFGTRTVWRLATATQTWTSISPELTGAAISAIGVSSVDARTLWAGTSDGLVHLTHDGGTTWTAVTPPSATRGDRVLRIETSHFDAGSAYLTMGLRGDAEPARVLRTRDSGSTWTPIVDGLPRTDVAVVREDAFRRGLLFAATSAGVHVSFDDGDTWQSLRQNMPPVAITDLTIKDADLVVSTAGRGFWRLEDISALRQITADVARADAFIFRPAGGWRMRATATAPWSPGESALSDPGSVIFYYLISGAGTTGPVTLDVIDGASGTTLRHFASDAPDPRDRVPATPGLHRVAWDGRLAPLRVPGNLAGLAEVTGVAAVPGVLQVRLVAGARTIRQSVSLRLDPRIRLAASDLTAQFALGRSLYDKAHEVIAAMASGVPAIPTASPAARSRAQMALLVALESLDETLRTLDRADGKPTPALQALGTAALARADAALAAAGP